MSAVSTVILLGPQAQAPVVHDALALLAVAGPIVTVTAGWEEREGELDTLQGHLGLPLLDLGLYARTEQLLTEDPAFLAAYRARRGRVRDLQRIYRIRLEHLMAADHDLWVRTRTNALAADERTSVLGQIRALDRHHARRLRDVGRDFEASLRPVPRGLDRQRAEVRAMVGGAGAVLIAGGHLPVLQNRLELFGLRRLLQRRPLIGWSAGAMALCRAAYLFYDDPPHGRGYPEVTSPGLGLVAGLVALPDASRRLRLDDEERVAMLARRVAPKRAALLDDGAGLLWDGRRLRPVLGGARVLAPDGRVRGWDAA